MTGQGTRVREARISELWVVELRFKSSKNKNKKRLGMRILNQSSLDHRMQIRRSLILGTLTQNCYFLFFYFILSLFLEHFQNKVAETREEIYLVFLLKYPNIVPLSQPTAGSPQWDLTAKIIKEQDAFS